MRNLFKHILVTALVAMQAAPMAHADAVIFSGSDVKTLKSNIDLNGQAKILSGTVDPSSSATTAPIGSLYLNSSNGNVYRKVDAGSSTNWSLVSSGGAAGINYITNDGAEVNTTGFATYADAAGTSPVDGTGGAPTLTLTRTTSSPLRGTGSYLITKDAANRQGEGAAYAFTIDAADKAKVLQISFDYEIASGTYADGDQAVYLYDVTNAQVIQPAGYSISKLNSGIYGKQIATFQTASNSTSYRLIFHTASTSASAYTVKVDNLKVGPQIVQYGAPVTDWVSYTPTLGAGFGTTTNSAFFYRRVGDTLQVKGFFTNGTVGAGAATVTIPSGMSLDTAKISPTNTSANSGPRVGYWRSSSGQPGALVTATGTSTSLIYFGAQDATAGALVGQTGTAITSSSVDMTVEFFVPIAGWSSTVQVSNDTDTRVVSFSGKNTSTQSVTSNTTNIAFTTVKDSHGAWSGSVFTVPVPGDYVVSGAAWDTGGSSSSVTSIYKNGTILANKAGDLARSISGAQVSPGSVVVPGLVAGDTLALRIDVTNTITTSALSIFRLSGPSAIAASEKVYLQYTGNAGGALTSSSNIDFTTKVADTHGAWNGTTFTAPRADVYHYSGMWRSTANVGTDTHMYVGGVDTLRVGTDYASASSHPFVGSIYLLAGQTFTIRQGATPTLSNSATLHHITIQSQ